VSPLRLPRPPPTPLPSLALSFPAELLHVGQKQAALQVLHYLITSKRYRTWQKAMEKIMFKYVELCVDMRKGRYAKDGLIQYRISCQQVQSHITPAPTMYSMPCAGRTVPCESQAGSYPKLRRHASAAHLCHQRSGVVQPDIVSSASSRPLSSFTTP